MIRALRFLGLLALLSASAGLRAQPVVEHRMDVLLTPASGTLAVRDTLTLPDGVDNWTFVLHEGLNPEVAEGGAELNSIGTQDHLEVYRLRVHSPDPVTLRYAGAIRSGLETLREGMGRSRQTSRGMISEDGVYLDGYSGWYPRDPNSLQRFQLNVQLPSAWTAVSQGAGPDLAQTADSATMTWREDQPQDDIYLLAAPFFRYAKPTAFGEAQVYLRTQDKALAERYLEATEHYLALYSGLIGPYPYAKFALVENFWETGYGMPSFTLLGPRVIRLPFIIHTSYPHEILHNWWGNGVYIDDENGNWGEGLTAYLADHLLKEERGQGADYRRDSLKSYADYVREGDDFPLRDFRGRHGSASQAIGYGKTLMVLHMLRRDLGDDIFLSGLRRFYRDNRFRTAGFDQLRHAFEQESGQDLTTFFAQWTLRTGAPGLSLTDVELAETETGYRLSGRIRQLQDDDPFPLNVPLVIHGQDGELTEHHIALPARLKDFVIDLATRPLRLTLDPRFDIFRQLAPGETPITLSTLFGAERGMIVLPTDADARLTAGYRELAGAWIRGSQGWKAVQDDQLDTLPNDRPIWLLGWENRFASAFSKDAVPYRLNARTQQFQAPGKPTGDASDSIALVTKLEGQAIGLVATGDPAALPGLARKLPHYGKYSYLVFAGSGPTNQVKGQWPSTDSPFTVWFSDVHPTLNVPPLPPLTATVSGDVQARDVGR